jgi:hypothetical protein
MNHHVATAIYAAVTVLLLSSAAFATYHAAMRHFRRDRRG